VLRGLADDEGADAATAAYPSEAATGAYPSEAATDGPPASSSDSLGIGSLRTPAPKETTS
jgi:hypothetical protein